MLSFRWIPFLLLLTISCESGAEPASKATDEAATPSHSASAPSEIDDTPSTANETPTPSCEPSIDVSPLASVPPALSTVEGWSMGAEDEAVLEASAIRDVNNASGAGNPVPQDPPVELAPLTRKALLSAALARLNQPIPPDRTNGLSALAELLAPTGLILPAELERLSSVATFALDLKTLEHPRKRMLILDAALAKGLVILVTPHDALLYLGRDGDGTGWVWMAGRSGVAGTCAEAPAVPQRRHPTQVTLVPLSLGEPSLLSEVETILVVGAAPGVEFAGIASLRKPAPLNIPKKKTDCKDSQRTAIYTSPRQPNGRQPLRITVVSERDLGPSELVLVDPDGTQHRPELHTLGGPPWSYHATVDEPRKGKWTIAIGEGERVEACMRIRVNRRAAGLAVRTPEGPVWELRRGRWTPAIENYYAAFVERLFDYPPDQDLTWEHLDALLRDAERNILYNHFSAGEEEKLSLAPDCADLAYYLRGYFAWKKGLPFAFRRCTRGKNRRAPLCEPKPFTNLTPREVHSEEDVLRTIQRFLEDDVRGTVHSSTGRTAPDDESTDFYPVPLTREALRPGIVFHDPYGHVMTLTRWVPQPLGGYGILLAADAQPDGTIGRRRFWRGTFLFTPDTRDVGAGFKAFRPFQFNDEAQVLVPLDNAALEKLGKKGRVVPFSRAQYEGSQDDFYDAVESLINPRPLDPSARLVALVEAFEEQVTRRVSSVDNGEKFMASRGFEPITMPKGTGIFLTSGPWEDYSTPSRDLRILIALDTVLGFPDAVVRKPERFGLAAEGLDARIAELREELDRELSSRSFQYTRSNGSPVTLTLKEVANRATLLEMAYNPNDCIEIRWAAPLDSEERASCKRRAPSDQQDKMASYRDWFHSRKRPR